MNEGLSVLKFITQNSARLLLAISFAACGLDANAAENVSSARKDNPAERPGKTDSDASQETLKAFLNSLNQSFALSPDGAMLAYSTRPLTGRYRDGEVSLWIKDLKSQKTTRLPGQIPLQFTMWIGNESRMHWSPDGRRLAYVAVENAKYYLHLWDIEDGSSRVFRKLPVCATLTCSVSSLVWSPDSTRIYHLAENPTVDPAEMDTTRTGGEVDGSRRRLLFEDPDSGGVTIRRYPPLKKASGAQDDDRPNAHWWPPVDVAVTDVQSGATTVLLTGAQARVINLSPDGKKLAVSAPILHSLKTGQRQADLYMIDTPKKVSNKTPKRVAGQVTDYRNKTVRPFAGRLNLWRAHMTWAPDSSRMAFADQGPLATGDIFLMDANTGERRNVSEGVEIPAAFRPMSKRNAVSGGKFGDPDRPVIWSPDGRYLFAIHGANLRERQFDPVADESHEIWRIDASSGEARKIAQSDTLRFHHILNDNGVAAPGDTPGRLLVAADGPGFENRILEIGFDGGRWETLLTFEGDAFQSFPERMFKTVRGGKIAFLNETIDNPEEILAFDLAEGNLSRLTSVNQSYDKTLGHSRRIISWRTPEGEKSQGVLYLPETASEDRPAPFVMSVYAGAKHSKDSGASYRGRIDALPSSLQTLLHRGYAILEPDFPVAGGGETCNLIGRHTEAAIDALGKLKVVDAARGGAYGHSHGGWTVTCMISRTTRLKAAVSGSGYSNLLSMRFSYADGRGYARMGGQTGINLTVWDNPMAFWAESPIGRADRIETPLLMLHGKEDPTTPFEQAVEMYIALSDLEKTVELVGYDGEDHASLTLRPDYDTRIIEWFNRYTLE